MNIVIKIFILYLCFHTSESIETQNTDIVNICEFPRSDSIDDILEENIQDENVSEEFLKD